MRAATAATESCSSKWASKVPVTLLALTLRISTASGRAVSNKRFKESLPRSSVMRKRARPGTTA